MAIRKTIWNTNKGNKLYYDAKVPLGVGRSHLCGVFKMGSKDREKGKDHRNVN